MRRTWWPLVVGAALGLALAVLLRERSDTDAVDLVSLQKRVLEWTGDTRVEVRHLGDGIIELVGEIEASAHAQSLVDALRDEPGVLAVLDRLWGSAS